MEIITVILLFIAVIIYKSNYLQKFIKRKIINLHLKRVSMSNDLRNFIITGVIDKEYESNCEYIKTLIYEVEDVRDLKVASHSIVSSIFVSFSVAFTGIMVAGLTLVATLYLNILSSITDKQLEFTFKKIKDLNKYNKYLENTFSEIVSPMIKSVGNPLFFLSIIGISCLLAVFPLLISKFIIRYGVTGILNKRLVTLRNIIYEDLKNHK
ncbi:hypothetical protein [Macrococcoides caseolyticum]|uniref:hypothetical protein n=1 Tax=Macrococcoides caseolyticum TaxID=69966 RepID=UPI001F331A27|nr:hypothetical protein [Macrococcus caseolyticus]MCE4958045.1 hypothetical protein [Macrococcus caseolyticus]